MDTFVIFITKSSVAENKYMNSEYSSQNSYI